MPRGDRTGPMGAGPMTGRAAGFCAGQPAPGFASGGGRGRGAGFGRGGGGWGRGGGFGRGAGRGMGWGWNMPAPAQPVSGEHELAVLKEQARQMQANMEAIQGRIQQLETPPQKDA